MTEKLTNKPKIAVVGLGYVGLPLAIKFGEKYTTLGYDKNELRVSQLKDGLDSSNEMSEADIRIATNIKFTSNEEDLLDSNIYIVTVPTPVDENNVPDLCYVIDATKLIAKYLNNGDVVIYESTVYPGATEDICVPILEEISSLELNEGFYVGYSPERINPGDKTNNISSIVKVTSGSNEKIASEIDDLYRSIVDAGTYKAKSIKVAEASKVIENVQRDVNIALINEFAMILNKMGIRTEDVLDAASSKWNFIPYTPGLVGGHCIGIDPYYLTHKAQEIGANPDLILTARKINESMSAYVVSELIKNFKLKKISGNNILIFGMSFKENCSDIRNSKIFDLIDNLKINNFKIDVYDPLVDQDICINEYQINMINNIYSKKYDGIIFAVAHSKFKDINQEIINKITQENHLIYDLKSVISNNIDKITL